MSIPKLRLVKRRGCPGYPNCTSEMINGWLGGPIVWGASGGRDRGKGRGHNIVSTIMTLGVGWGGALPHNPRIVGGRVEYYHISLGWELNGGGPYLRIGGGPYLRIGEDYHITPGLGGWGGEGWGRRIWLYTLVALTAVQAFPPLHQLLHATGGMYIQITWWPTRNHGNCTLEPPPPFFLPLAWVSLAAVASCSKTITKQS